jgi:hypothetical protein
MECPPRIANLITQILGWGILRIRVLGWDGQADACAVEADHLHNLPSLLRDFSPALLAFYLRTSREAYLAQLSEPPLEYRPLWKELEDELARLLAQTP